MKKRTALRGNDNAVKHGGYRQLNSVDARTREGKILRDIEAGLVTALGGDPSPQETLLLQRVCVKALRCSSMEYEIITKDRDAAERVQKDYLRWARELREDLKTLGLERRAKKVLDVKTWAETKYGD